MQIGKGSSLLGAEHGAMEDGHGQQHHHPQQPDMQGQHMAPQGMVPVAYMAPGMGPVPPYMGMEQPYPMQRPQMWHGTHMQSFVPQYVVPAMQAQGYRTPPQSNSAAAAAPPKAHPHPAGAGPSMATHNHPGGSTMEGSRLGQYPPGVSRVYPAASAASNAASATSASAGQQSVSAEALAVDGTTNLSPDLQQLVRQLAMQQLSGHQARPPPEDL